MIEVKIQGKWLLLMTLFLLSGNVALSQNAESTFSKYFEQAQVFSAAYPQEKVHLHFDNTSYFVGDTIWFKAYVTQGENNAPTTLSRPLYIELLDQLGHVSGRQIIKLENGEGAGQFVIERSGLSGYFEIRAFTKWMLAFNNEQYFSRTFPVYRPKQDNKDGDRSITTYNMDASMKQRPKTKEETLSVRFFPEGGQLVEGITSIVAFKAESKKEGTVSISGVLRTEEGEELTQFNTLHDGMGCLTYTPRKGKKVMAEVTYHGEKYRFRLPEALSNGYVLNASNRNKRLDIKILCNELTATDTLALFVSHQGRPLVHKVLSFTKSLMERLVIPTEGLPGGVLQLTLLNRSGATLSERFCYVMPEAPLKMEVQTDGSLYYPFAPIQCKIKAMDQDGKPMKTKLSVSIRHAFQSDYLEYDNTIYTDLLLTSELKGYIHQPGYYFAESTSARQQELDVLLMVHGWRKYNLSEMVGTPPVQPRYLPENRLNIHGQLKSYVLKREQENLEVSILAKNDSTYLAGHTLSDSLGYFDIPIEGFEGTIPTNFQTRKPGSKNKKMCSVLLFRNFSPDLRTYNFFELNPKWSDSKELKARIERKDSLYLDSIRRLDPFFLSDVTIKARYPQKRTVLFEESIDAYYDVPQLVDKMRDEGKEVFSLYKFLEAVNPRIRLIEGKDMEYKQKYLPVILDGKVLRRDDRFIVEEDIDAIKTVVLCSRAGAWDGLGNLNIEEDVFTGSEEAAQANETAEGESTDDTAADEAKLVDAIKRGSREKGLPVVCYLISADGWNANRDFRPGRGVRSTRVQGYATSFEFYSPAYRDGVLPQDNDRRRTLYWNPKVETDENGCAVVQCYNGNSTTSLIINAETICDGKPGAVVKHSLR